MSYPHNRIVVIITVVIMVLVMNLLGGCYESDPFTETIYTTGGFQRLASDDTGGYIHEYGYAGILLSTGGSGATFIQPNVSSLGGYRLDNLIETLYFTTHVGNDWDGVSDGIVEISFEVNVDNTGGADTDVVEMQLECWHKLDGERMCTVYSLDGSTTVGKADQHDLFQQDILLTNIRAGETISFRINLNTIFSDVTSIILNYVEFKYHTKYPAMEVN